MRSRSTFWILLGLLVLAGAWFFWPAGERTLAQKRSTPAQQAAAAAQSIATSRAASTAPLLFAAGKSATNSVAKTNQFAWRLSNTPKSIGQLMNDPHAILLENALIEIGAPLNFSIPKNLQSPGDPGAYIVQARGPVDDAFRALLTAADAGIVSYIPNNAYLVRISSGGAAALAGQPQVQSVIPYEPYYKISSALIGAAVQQKNLPDNSALTLGLFADDAQTTVEQIKQLGGTVVGNDQSPFGPIVRVVPPANWTALATLPGVQIVELAHHRKLANDLARVTLGISTDTVTNANYRGLSGSNVVVEVNDTGIDATHPDFSLTGSAGNPGSGPTRVFGLPLSLVDTNGHGTHVGGIIAGNGSESYTVASTPQGSVTNADFRGKAPAARLYSFAALDNAGILDISDYILQSTPALTNALISNNSWTYDDSTYNLAAASYDAAVRDSLPFVTGSQPVLFVFAAGNDGGGNDGGGAGDPDTILSPGTAKDVITVGALEQLRNITNIVTDAAGNSNAVWLAATDDGTQVTSYSARGNVGIGTEGAFGRFKPDVVAPGSFVISTRSQQWDTNAYYNPTNYYFQQTGNLILGANSSGQQSLSLNFYPPNVIFYSNIVGVQIDILPNADSPSPFPNLLVYISHLNYPNPAVPSSWDYLVASNEVAIPNPVGGSAYLSQIQNGNLFLTIVNTNNQPINFDFSTEITATNENGNYFQVLLGLNETLAPYYRYESGTSMAAPAVSGVLALMQDYFTNTLRSTPSPALLKALLINGARPVGNYTYAVTNGLNFEGWGLANVTNSLPFNLTNQPGAACASFFLDQSPTNALATGNSQTFIVSIGTNFFAQAFPLQVTLAWTDPPGNPAAAIKLVNNLDLVVTNLDTGDVYFGNDIPSGSTFNAPWNTNSPPNLDAINNVENIFLPPVLGSRYSVTVLGTGVNVNAVTAQTNNVVQDYALVISSGDGAVTNAITVTPSSVPNPFARTLVTFVGTTNALLLNQFAGGNTPLLGTNTVGAGAGYITNAVITLGITNQWHFYVVTNTLGFTNAAFITVLSDTLATPRIGVFADPTQNPTQPEADVDMYVATEPGLLNLDPNVISNCVHGFNGDGASLGNGTGTEFVAYSNSVPGGVYYIGIKSETQEAAEYAFLPVFSLLPFSALDSNGNEIVNGLLLPVNIPDGSPAHPGTAYVFALAVQPIQVENVIVTNTIYHQNFGDLIGALSHGGQSVVLNNHNPNYNNSPGFYTFIYDQSPSPVIGSQPADGPGSLVNFQDKQGIGPWILTEVDNALTETGAVTGLTLFLKKHQDLNVPGVHISIAPQSWFYGYIDVPVGATNLTIAATNTFSVPGNPPLQLFVKLGGYPTLTNYDKSVVLTNGTPPGGSISIGPSDVPRIQPGRYYVGIYNGSGTPYSDVFVVATIALGQVDSVNFGASGPVPLLDDAVTDSSIFVTNQNLIAGLNVGIRVDHPRISDLVFHLVSPDGTRYLLMENRGGTSTNGAGVTSLSTNQIANVTASGSTNANTNFVFVSQSSGTLPISWNFFTVPDQMTVYDTTNNFTPANLIFDTGMVSGIGQTNLPFTTASGYLTVIMNQFGNTNGANGDNWTYTAGGVSTNYYYLILTEDTNLTTTPIKFAPPPFVPLSFSAGAWHNSFEGGNGSQSQTINSINYFANGWLVSSGNIDWLKTGFSGSTAYEGSYFIDLNGNTAGVISTNVPTTIGRSYILSFAYARNPASIGMVNPVAQLKLNSSPALTITVTNMNAWTALQWATTSVVFNATSASTPLEFDSLTSGASGVLLDAVNLQLTNYQVSNLYYQPEQDLSPLNGTSAYGAWTLEIQDDRVGATNNAVLDSWQLQFAFANTNPVPTVIIGGIGQTNSLPPGGLAWYEVDVPTNADFATNILIFATGPLNMLFSTNTPPTTGNPGDVQFLSGQTAGSVVLGTNGSPANVNLPAYMVAGGTYFIGIQNPDALTVQYGFRVDFHLNLPEPFAFTQPAQAITGSTGKLNGMATPNGFPSTAWFQWGTNIFYGNNTPPIPVGAGYNVVYVTNSITGLLTNTQYHFRLVVSNALGVVAGFDQIFEQANVVVWGADYVGQANVPASLSNNVVAIAGAYDHSLALKNDGTALGWGDNNFGQSTVPAGLSNLLAVAGGQYYSFALKSNGTVSAWGGNILAQTNVPAGLNNVVTIAGGTYSSLALKNDGSVVAWGASFFNLTNVPSNATNIVAIAGGAYHSLAIKNDGTVVAWGDNSAGQTNIPSGLNNVVAISGGSYHSLALKNDGTVVSWGDNSSGQTNVPSGLSNVVAIAAGGFHSLALKNDGTITAWGDDTAGQIIVPLGLSNVVAIASGYFHSMALTSLTNIFGVNSTISDLAAGQPTTNTIFPHNINYYRISVPTNADFATNDLIFALNGPLNVWFTTNTPPTITNANDALLLAGVTNGISVLTTNLFPRLIPGATYYLGVNNTNSFAVTYAIEVDFHLVTATNTPPLTNAVPISSIIRTNIGGTNGFLLTWFAPSNALFQVQFTTNLVPANWQAFTNPASVSYNTNFAANATNAQFNFFDDGSQAPFGPTRFYRLILLGSGSPNTPPVFVATPTNRVTNPLNPLVVTNAATDADVPAQTLTYSISSTVTGTNLPAISTNGVITWTPDTSQAGSSNVITTMVTDNGTPPLSATNSFSVLVNPVPGISSVTYSNGGFLLTWFAPTNDIFQVQVATNLASPIVWLTFSNFITYTGPVTSTNGLFSFYDNGSQYPFASLRFYRLQLVGIAPPPASTIFISSIVASNGFFRLTWSAPTNDQFNVRWATNLMTPITWTTFLTGPITSTNGIFSFTDTNAPLLLKFYELMLLP